MKNSLYIFIVIIITLLFIACGGSGDGNIDVLGKNENITMKIGKSYTMKKGQIIIKDSETTQILLETKFDTGKTTAILVSGKAKIEG